jgi:fatty-acyl-CoA synthase
VDRAVNLFAMLDQATRRFPDRGALYHGDRRVCTWGELRDRALRLATSIRQQEGAGACVAIASHNRPEIVELMFAIWATECVVVPINYKLHPREMAQILDDAGVSQVFASSAIGAELASVTTAPTETIGSEDYSRRLSFVPSTPPCTDPSTLAWLFYTSGTTGRSKGAMLSHRNLTAMTVAPEWNRTASRVAGEARRLLLAGDLPAARDAFLRAANYFRAAEFYATHDDARQMTAWQASWECAVMLSSTSTA